ncbi:hypothetical protein GU700_16390 [Methylobacterium sp. NI91]|nr:MULTISPECIES: EscD/YscD/HrpQ family type III secretion system periplasmic domain-containing protein [unclassified Methylobacterium]QIJ76046.1 hypothetical protein CLZ_16385 [Methylobacterium sp. CLZ]QIJ80948.1 hypothetical protein GU700_16390 [Methylobacterium sp. NI91]
MDSAVKTSERQAGYRLEIRSGLYAGVTHDVGEGRLVLGSGPEADILLMEPDFAPVHAAVVLQERTIRVEGLSSGVAVTGIGPVPAGAARTIRLPATVEIGGVALVWDLSCASVPETRAARPLGAVRRLFARPAVPGIAAAGVLAVTVLLTLSNPIAGAAVLIDGADRAVQAHVQSVGAAPPAMPTAALPASVPPPAAAKAALAGSVPAPQKPVTVEAAAKALQDDIAGAGLLNVHVRASGGAVTATGTIEPAMTSRWEGLQKAFDERFAGDVTLVNSVAVKVEKLPASLGIEGVWRGAQPYIVVRGQRYLAGAVVDGGWTIRGIEHDRVMLERDGRLVAMRF